MFFNKNIKYLTKHAGLNQNQLAKKMGVSRQAVAALLTVSDPRVSTVIKVSSIYNVSIDDLLLKDLSEENK